MIEVGFSWVAVLGLSQNGEGCCKNSAGPLVPQRWCSWGPESPQANAFLSLLSRIKLDLNGPRRFGAFRCCSELIIGTFTVWVPDSWNDFPNGAEMEVVESLCLECNMPFPPPNFWWHSFSDMLQAKVAGRKSHDEIILFCGEMFVYQTPNQSPLELYFGGENKKIYARMRAKQTLSKEAHTTHTNRNQALKLCHVISG